MKPPEDEFADFETWDVGAINAPEAKTPNTLPREYAREVYKRGLQYEAKLGANPFKLGMVGSTDSHTALSTAEESQYFGKISMVHALAPPRHSGGRRDEARRWSLSWKVSSRSSPSSSRTSSASCKGQ